MVIVNLPFTKYFKSFSHTKAQIRVATLGDKFLTNLCSCLGIGWSNYTIYEFPFPEIKTDMGIRNYEGDVYFQVIDSNPLPANYHMLVEIDGKVNHDSKYAQAKDKFRDWNLYEKLGCQTIRFQTSDVAGGWRKIRGRRTNVVPLTDLEIFRDLNMVECMNLPVPNSAHWRDLLHKCLHDSCIDPQ